jgi:hypothetical protein
MYRLIKYCYLSRTISEILVRSLFMGSVDLPGNSGTVVKQSKAHFELGANLVDQKVRIATILFIHWLSCISLNLFISYSTC